VGTVSALAGSSAQSAAPSANAAPPAASAEAATIPASTTTAVATATAAAATTAQAKAAGGKEEPGYLTIVCNPYCDEVFDQGKSLGPSPVVHLAVPPGSHRITLKKGKDSKVLSVIVVSGQVSAQRIAMK
jgi:serine/threonine-protein kinase